LKLNFRVSVKRLIKIELVVAFLSFGIATALPFTGEFLLIVAGMCLIHALIYAPVGITNGFDFVMYDAPPDSPLKFYHFLSIFIAGFFSARFFDTTTQLSESLRGLIL
jgi:hypothetical protein